MDSIIFKVCIILLAFNSTIIVLCLLGIMGFLRNIFTGVLILTGILTDNEELAEDISSEET